MDKYFNIPLYIKNSYHCYIKMMINPFLLIYEVKLIGLYKDNHINYYVPIYDFKY